LCGENWISTCKRLNLDPQIALYKNKFKIYKRSEILKLPRKHSKTLEDMGYYFLNRIPIVQDVRARLTNGIASS
jgi:hypothetical protein